MLDETFENLKIKPNPKKQKDFSIFLENLADPGNMPNIIDKTSEKLVNRKDFFSLISKDLQVVSKDSQQEQKKKIDPPIPKGKLNTDPDIKFTKQTKDQPKFTNIVKTSTKIIIKEIEDPEFTKGVKLPSKVRLTPKPATIDETIDLPKDLKFGRTLYSNRIPKIKPTMIKASDYYLYNRETFINFINSLFSPYKDELIKQERELDAGKTSISCDETANTDFSLLIHQKIVRDYINLYTPYRGLLLYHGLGSGKTCSSIAITEGMKNDKKILVMTPASLRDNYIEELKKCGDYLYKKNQFWEFLSIKSNPDYLQYLSTILKLPEEYIKKNGGAWFINVKKEPNYDSLPFDDQKKINEQIDKMIFFKYEFISYNGLRNNHLISMTRNNTINPFSNKVIIIDEAHNFISRIVNKLRNKNSLSMKLYNYLMDAENCKIVLLTGTPIINYPNEIGILFNILRGSIRTYSCKLIVNKQKLSKEQLESLLKKESLFNYVEHIEYNSLTYIFKITQNPYGYINTTGNKKKLVYTSDPISSEEFKQKLIEFFNKNNIEISSSKGGEKIHIESNKALPDDFDTFKAWFIDPNNNIKNSNMLKMRIVGLTSYFRSAQEQLMPKYDHTSPNDFKVIEVLMSDFQFGIYEEARSQERTLEEKNKKKQAKKSKLQKDEIYSDSVSTYRIFSRAFCNFVFPKPDIKRPMPNNNDTIETALDNIDEQENVTEDILDDLKPEEKVENVDGKYEVDDIDDIKKQQSNVKDNTYQKRIEEALFQLEKFSERYLTKQGLQTYSPKFLHILENIIDDDHKGIHLLYSQFKTLEGIGIFKLVLKQNNFVEFKFKKSASGEFILDIDESDFGKPMFALYTGSESSEEREIIKNVLNSNWKLVPSSIVKQLEIISPDNNYGQIIKVLMITASGAEGISLKNVRYVHIMEPYWHPVRIHQVIGRAKRICSHSNLPKELQTVTVFLYLMKFTEAQLESDLSIELKLKDKSKKDKSKILTSDEFLYEISSIKEDINKEILNKVKESAIDCSIHTRSTSKESLKCFIIGNPSENKYMYTSNIDNQDDDKAMELNKKTEGVKLAEYEFKGKKYALDPKKNELYNYDNYLKGELLLEARFVKQPDGKYLFEKL
tara:strand:+ start:84 stop:3455 length:3372 start_codon:yes stop_codon:yes gene_type:complete